MKDKSKGLKIHIKRKDHDWSKAKRRSHLTERRDIKRDKLEARQAKMPKVR